MIKSQKEHKSKHMIKIIGICGSLRKNSYNKMLLQNASSLAPEGTEINIFEISGIPLYNQDLESDFPKEANNLKQSIKEADAVLFATPEYNYSFPGVLKNAIDWASRPMGDNSWNGKPAGIIGATMGGFGTIRGQSQLRQCLSPLNMIVMPQPEYFLSTAHEKFDASGIIIDQNDKEKLRSYMKAFSEWILRFKNYGK